MIKKVIAASLNMIRIFYGNNPFFITTIMTNRNYHASFVIGLKTIS